MERSIQGIEISEESLPAFRALLELNERTWREFLTLLNTAYRDNLDQQKLVQSLLDGKIEGLTPGTVDLLFEVGLSVYNLSMEVGVSVEKALKMAKKSLERQLSSALVAARLEELVNSEALWSLHKIRDVVSDENFSFKEARIITELRPIFGKSIKEQPIAFAVMHSLKIGYLKDFTRGEYFLCLNEADINSMIEELKRAQEKAETLRATTQKTGVYILQNSGA